MYDDEDHVSGMAADIITAYLSNPNVNIKPDELTDVIKGVFSTIKGISSTEEK